MSATTAISNVAAAVKSAFDWLLEKLRLKNSAKMQANAEARTDQEIKDNAGKIVASGDLEKIQKANSE
ncbi:hypothetical protein OPIT5_29355 [Opitutaceae bacterium TAV5]|nr:hypothetical protein OPIT5_21765 [Opitutaceae bacterium TAV5]AHF93686.1 hypothetical protein OPIT5_29355 [Opitutaceae bacterium TAV5]